MIRAYSTRLAGTLAACVAIGLIGFRPQTGLFLTLLGPLLLAIIIPALYVAWNKPQERAVQYLKLVLCVITLATGITLHVHYVQAARSSAQDVVAFVEAFRESHDRYPTTAEVEAAPFWSATRLWRIGYAHADGVVLLTYPSTNNPFDRYFYNFAQRTWKFLPA
ncbi:hypothetical protein [Tahibacter amnicola]|uniref:Uncharacterized protein n=1 Tax=Tahibacter amnicola TaxID=2976241 RepID=A0ABY6BGD9_9GAMM|nr:hypothetical protein [Tahibacter amnicola]UXI67435.1 hypothetical protein N4264_22290 [Tahibacter amnicola]